MAVPTYVFERDPRTGHKVPNGKIYINPVKRHVRSFYLTARDNPTTALPALPNTGFLSDNLR